MKVFTQNLMKLAPEWAALPSELIQTFDWMEDQGWLHMREGGQPEDHWLSIYPDQFLNHPSASNVTFGGTSLTLTGHWETPDPALDNRLFEIGETSGDGGRLAIWRDDTGTQQFVHLGHDNAGIITDDPLVVLQFLAIGYPEPEILEQTDMTPQQAFFDYHGIYDMNKFSPEDRPVYPLAFQGFLKQRFGLGMPASARAIGIADFAPYHDSEAADPFARWIAEITPPPSEAELAYEMELMRTVESLNIKDDDETETIMSKIGTLFQAKD